MVSKNVVAEILEIQSKVNALSHRLDELSTSVDDAERKLAIRRCLNKLADVEMNLEIFNYE